MTSSSTVRTTESKNNRSQTLVDSIMENSTKAYNKELAQARSKESDESQALRFLDFLRPADNILFLGVNSLRIIRNTVRFREEHGHSGDVVVMVSEPNAVKRTCRHTHCVKNIPEYLEKYDPSDTLLVFSFTLNKSIAGKNMCSPYEYLGRLFSKHFSRIYINEHMFWSNSYGYSAPVSEAAKNSVRANENVWQALAKYRFDTDDRSYISEGLLIHFCTLCAGTDGLNLKALDDASCSDYFSADDSRIVQYSIREGWEVNYLEQYTNFNVAKTYKQITGTELTKPTSYHLLISRI